ncbi:epidermal growth factor-like protein 8 [Ostrea edulis]|uniref:epidermal growth factor-like protein 8 n=1 Tax=Ostrea edulis TaxID=37623 RepID=UPI00209545E7|nr:epidermal growth factor-like protein 8 [Ostrea edulis]
MSNFGLFVFIVFSTHIIYCLPGKTMHSDGRRVCRYHGGKIEMVPTRQSYRRPFYDKKMCSNDSSTCINSTRVYMRIVYRTVFYKRVVQGEHKRCCPGWTKKTPRDMACLAPICRHGCKNGGICVGPNKCECPPYYTGRQCQHDLDECLTGRSSCQQICKNTIGGYECGCFHGFKSVDKYKCEFCPLCIQPLEDMMNKVNYMQGRLNEVEKEKEEMRGNFSVLERYYNDAMSQVEELKSASSHTTPPALATTTEDPYDFDIISSLSDQISQLEERLGSCDCGNRGQRGRHRYDRRWSG